MSDSLPDTWHARDVLVLREAVRSVDLQPQGGVTGRDLASATGLSIDDVYRATVALRDAGFIDARDTWEGGEPVPFFVVTRVSGPARQTAGSWPTPETALDRIIAALEAIAANTDDDDERTRARKILDSLTGADRQIGIAVAGAAISGQIPGAS